MSALLASVCTGLAVLVLSDWLWVRKQRRWRKLLGEAMGSWANLLSIVADLPYPVGTGDIAAGLRKSGKPAVSAPAWIRRRLQTLLPGVSGLLLLALTRPSAVSLPLAMGITGISYWWPDLLLARDSRRRRRRVQATFPGFLDLMATCAQAGHSLYACMMTVAPHLRGPLGEVFVAVCGQLAAGRRLWPALETARQQAALPEVDTFVAAMAEADFLGSPIADTLRQLAQLARTQRRYAMESAIATLPLKLSICTVFFFLPPVFVLLVVPNLVAFMMGTW
ncbi:MAG TPA: hypothetical protein DCM14_01505 [Clostridiales bacterium UBA8153]|nr:hypothetical protein [Clostridiales bacterium UBA8153]